MLYLKPKDFNYKLEYGCYMYTVHMPLHIAKYTCLPLMRPLPSKVTTLIRPDFRCTEIVKY